MYTVIETHGEITGLRPVSLLSGMRRKRFGLQGVLPMPKNF